MYHFNENKKYVHVNDLFPVLQNNMKVLLTKEE